MKYNSRLDLCANVCPFLLINFPIQQYLRRSARSAWLAVIPMAFAYTLSTRLTPKTAKWPILAENGRRPP